MIEYEIKFSNENLIKGQLKVDEEQRVDHIKRRIFKIQSLKQTDFILQYPTSDIVDEKTEKIVMVERKRSIFKDRKRHQSEDSIYFEEESMISFDNQKFLFEEPQKPPKVIGRALKCNSFCSCFTSSRILVLDFNFLQCFSNEGQFSNPDINLNLGNIKQLKSYKKKKYYFIKIIMKNGVIYDFRFPNQYSCLEWINYLTQSMEYYHYLQQKQTFLEKDAFSNFITSIKKQQARIVKLQENLQTMSGTHSHTVHKGNTIIQRNSGFVRIADFEIRRRIGKGAFSSVYEGEKDGKVYALKQLDKDTLFYKQQMKYALSQLSILKRSVHCPFIIPIYYAFQTYQYLYLALKYCPFGTLSDHVEMKNTLPYEEAFHILCQLIVAIDFLHSENILYRDLKPENILIDADGHVMLIDFGLSIQLQEDQQFADSFLGTPLFMPPQRVQGTGRVNYKADIYGVGCIFYYMLHGKGPFHSQNFSSIIFNLKNSELQINPKINKIAKLFLKETLEKNPEKRTGNMKGHPLFEKINWGKVQRKQLPGMKIVKGEKITKSEVNYKIDTDYTAENYPKNKIAGWQYP